MKSLLTIFLIASSLFAQYKNTDYKLVKTGFDRIFNKEIISKYIHSSNGDSVKAGLLCLSHSNDTSWVNEIIKLDFEKYGDYISFALGQIGQSQNSTKYLLENIFNQKTNYYLIESFQALGNTGDSSTINLLMNKINKSDKNNLTGLPYALYNFSFRGLLPAENEFIDYLISQIGGDNSFQNQFDALFALYRFNGSLNAEKKILEILRRKEENFNPLKYYALGCLRKASQFPRDEKIFNELLTDVDPRIRTEAARTLCYYDFKNFTEIEKYLDLLFDKNPNVSRQTAISFVNIKAKGELKEKLYLRIYELINNPDLTENVKGELFINYCNYKKENYLKLIDKFENEIRSDFIYRLLSNNIHFPLQNFDYIKNNIKDTTEVDFLNIAQAILQLQDSLKNNDEFGKFVLSILNSSSPLGIALIADNLDSVIVAKNINAIQQIVIEQIFKYSNNKNYLESIRALHVLSKRISQEFENEVLMILKTSKVNWVKTYAKKNLGEEINLEQSKDISFDEIWNNAFKYSRAKVITNKGSFVIELTPQVAPISVGNFCYLVSQNYFDNVIFHRVVPNFVIQTGDPSSTGWGGPGYEIVSEFSLQPYDETYVGMASSGKDTEGSQWFVMHSSYPNLNWRYSNFGKVIEGMDIVNIIDQKDKIVNIELIK